MKKILVSACLFGIKCRYKGDDCLNTAVLEKLKDCVLIPVCPEQLGGLATPRNPSEIVGEKVYMNDGTDVTEQYRRGAEATLEIAKKLGVDCCILKANSPSCGSKKIYDGTFTGKKIDGMGVTARLLKENGFTVLDENDLEGQVK